MWDSKRCGLLNIFTLNQLVKKGKCEKKETYTVSNRKLHPWLMAVLWKKAYPTSVWSLFETPGHDKACHTTHIAATFVL